MKDTGIIRKIDELGRVVIPKTLRTQLGLKEGDTLEFHVRGSEIVLTKFKEPDYILKKNDFGEEMLVNNKGEIVIPPKLKITPMDIAEVVGVELAIEQA